MSIFDSEDKDRRRQRWEKRKGWHTTHFGIESVLPTKNFPDPKDYMDKPEVVVEMDELVGNPVNVNVW